MSYISGNLTPVEGGEALDIAIDMSVHSEGMSAEIQIHGCGLKTGIEYDGGVVIIENRNGIPYVIVWADINQEDPTHVISLEKALESNRQSEPSQDNHK